MVFSFHCGPGQLREISDSLDDISPWTLTFAAFAPREALPGEAPRVSSSTGWPECDLLLQSLRHPHAQEILLVSALPHAHGSLTQLWAWASCD